MPPARNPYLNRSMIRSAEEFYGRRREMRRILSRIGAGTPPVGAARGPDP